MADILDCRYGHTSDDDVALLLTRKQVGVLCSFLGIGGGKPNWKNQATRDVFNLLITHLQVDDVPGDPEWNGRCLTFKDD